eukprot:2965478-Rhodomonas_salina.1
MPAAPPVTTAVLPRSIASPSLCFPGCWVTNGGSATQQYGATLPEERGERVLLLLLALLLVLLVLVVRQLDGAAELSELLTELSRENETLPLKHIPDQHEHPSAPASNRGE